MENMHNTKKMKAFSPFTLWRGTLCKRNSKEKFDNRDYFSPVEKVRRDYSLKSEDSQR